MALTALSIVPCPVRMMTSVSICAVFIRSSTSSPVNPGMFISTMATSKDRRSQSSRASLPLAADATVCPLRVIQRAQVSRKSGSSSTISRLTECDVDMQFSENRGTPWVKSQLSHAVISFWGTVVPLNEFHGGEHLVWQGTGSGPGRPCSKRRKCAHSHTHVRI